MSSVIFVKCLHTSFLGMERGSRVSQKITNRLCHRVRASEHAPRDPIAILACRHGFAEIVERGVGVPVERRRVSQPRPKRDFMTLAENAPRNGRHFARHCLGFFEALKLNKTPRVVAG